MIGGIRHIHKDPNQVIALRLPFVPPETTDRLRLSGHGPEALFLFEQRLGHDIITHRLAIIEP
jgi:hypothetical protein